MALRPYCSVCHAHYRGIYPAHAATRSHLMKLRRSTNNIITNRHDMKVSLGIPTVNVRRALNPDYEEGKQKVRRYRRSRPNDGTARVVGVRRYWRSVPWRAARADFGKRKTYGDPIYQAAAAARRVVSW